MPSGNPGWTWSFPGLHGLSRFHHLSWRTHRHQPAGSERSGLSHTRSRDLCARSGSQIRDCEFEIANSRSRIRVLPDYATLQRQLNAALAGTCPSPATPPDIGHRPDVDPLPRQPFRDLDEIYRGQAKSGTSHFHAYATAYVVRKGQRYTVALTGVKKGETLKDVVQRLLRQAAQRRCPAPAAAAGSRLLQRGGDPLPPGGALSVPDAGGLPRPLAHCAVAPPAVMSSRRERRAVVDLHATNSRDRIRSLEFAISNL